MEPVENTDSMMIPEPILSRLQAIGIHSAIDALHAPFDTITQAGLAHDELVSLQSFFLQVGAARRLVEARNEIHRSETVGTGCQSLDALLRGGAHTGMVTDFFGRSGSGKTQICFQLAINASKNGSNVVFIDSTGTFRPERLTELCERRGLDPDSVLSSIYVARPHSVADQMRMVREFEEVFGLRSASLLALDSLTENFISEYEGEKGLIGRQTKLAQHLHDLAGLALRAQLPVVVTNTVRTRVTASGLQAEVESGGNIVAQGLHLRIHLKRGGQEWTANIIQPQVKDSYARFRIAPEGIVC